MSEDEEVGNLPPNHREMLLLGRAMKLLDKGCVRYSDREFELEREQLVKDIELFFFPPKVDEPAPAEPPPTRRPSLPVVK